MQKKRNEKTERHVQTDKMPRQLQRELNFKND